MIEVIRSGLFTTIQDLGRFGFRSTGVPVSGPMDQTSAAFANELLQNDPNDPLIEMAYVGATFLFNKSATIAFAGAICEVKLNNEIVRDRSVLKIEAGSVISFGAMKEGNFLYLAILGGFKTDKLLGSACYYEAVNGMARMSKGMRLSFQADHQQREINLNRKVIGLNRNNGIIEVEKGPEFHLLSEEDAQVLTQTQFTISPQSNRMGILLNELVEIESKEIISSPVQAGTVQLTKGGQLIVLMRDAQTVGGYPRVLQLTEKSINQLVQTRFNMDFRFELARESA
ncbi:MAG: biotin-dependent carboxyltransferase family protein [Crocinitomicaceae bacterium]|nr:biotin-dependent carboxyltransferase family protein [Crocinitomicaceae bacterium]